MAEKLSEQRGRLIEAQQRRIAELEAEVDGLREMVGHLESFKTGYSKQVERVEYLEAELTAAKRAIEDDRTAVIDGVNALTREIQSRSWIAEGRGNYEWDDERYQQEFVDAAEAIRNALEPLKKIGRDRTNCPQTTDEVVKARMDLEAKADALDKLAKIMRRCEIHDGIYKLEGASSQSDWFHISHHPPNPNWRRQEFDGGCTLAAAIEQIKEAHDAD